MSQSDSTGVTTDPATVGAALRFGGIVLPPSARVLGVQYDKGIDLLYRVVISVDHNSVAALLSGSGFTAPLAADPGPFMMPIDGFGLEAATTVSSTSDTLPPAGDRTSTVFREVVVDHSDPTQSIIHMWLFTT